MMQFHEPPFRLKEFKVEVTHRCELNCIHCSSDAMPSNDLQMGRDDCLRILKEAATLGAERVALSGGEPLSWPSIYDAVETAICNGLEVTIYTSGNSGDFRAKVRRLNDLGAQRLVFSVFGDTASSHERITRAAGSFERSLTAMSEARDAGLVIEIHFVPMSSNYRELEGVVSLAKERGATRVSILRLVPQGRAALLRGRILSRVQNLELRRQIGRLRKMGHNIRTGSPYNFLLLNVKPQCCAAIDRLIIGPDLRLYPCDAFKQVKAEELVGTLDGSSLLENSLEECWEKSPYLEAVRGYLTTLSGPPCDSCALLDRCLSGCLAQKVVAYGNLEKRPDPDCLGPDFREGQT